MWILEKVFRIFIVFVCIFRTYMQKLLNGPKVDRKLFPVRDIYSPESLIKCVVTRDLDSKTNKLMYVCRPNNAKFLFKLVN